MTGDWVVPMAFGALLVVGLVLLGVLLLRVVVGGVDHSRSED